MGRVIAIYANDDAPCPPLSQQSQFRRTPAVSHLLRNCQNLSGPEINSFLTNLFQAMSIDSKHALTEILWRNLSPVERESIELPFYQHRWDDVAINSALSSAFVDANQRSELNEASGGISPGPPQRMLSDMIEFDLARPADSFGNEGNITLRDLVTGLIASSFGRRGIGIFPRIEHSSPEPEPDRE